MDIVIVGGLDRLKHEYERMGDEFGIGLKAFSGKESNISTRIGAPGAILLFTNMVSHKARQQVMQFCRGKGTPVVYMHQSGVHVVHKSLKSMLEGRFERISVI